MRRGGLLRAAVLLLPAAGAAAGGADPAPLRPADAATIDFSLPSPEEPWLGVSFLPGASPPALRAVAPDGPAAHAGLRAGDVLAALDGVEPPDGVAAAWMVRLRVPGERVRVEFVRDGVPGSTPLLLGRRPGEGALFRGPVFRLAVIPVALDDRPRGPEPSDAVLDRLFFSRDSHVGRLPSGRTLHGGLRDYWRDQSGGRLDVVGRLLPTVAVAAAARTFAVQPMGAGPDSLAARTLAALHARDGTAALAAFDGIAFLYPGDVASPPRRGLWPHRGTLRVGGRVLPYFVKNLGEGEPEPLGVLAHEFGHLLGLPDQYGTAHRTGVGDFCLMALGHRGGGSAGADRPFGLCAWCRTVLGWCRPAAVGPARGPARALRPASGPRGGCHLPGGSDGEAYLLENRRRAGWDRDLPGEGLLVWRAGAPILPGQAPDTPWLDLLEAHGMEAPDASLLRPDEIPFPGPRGGVLSEETHPGRAGRLRLSSIRALPGGVVAFRVAEPGPFEAPPPRIAPAETDAEGFALLRDPVTGERVRVFMGPPERTPAREAGEVEALEPVTGD